MPLPPEFESVDESDLAATLGAAVSGEAHFAEVFLERRTVRSLRREEGRIHSAGASLESGAGVRAVAGQATGYAWTSSPLRKNLIEAARAASKVASAAPGGGLRTLSPFPAAAEAPPVGRLSSPAEDLLSGGAAYLEELDDLARASDGRVFEVSCSVAEERRTIGVANTGGLRAAERQVLTSVRIVVYVRGPRGTLKGQYGGGGREEFDALASGRLSPALVAGEAVRRALAGLGAIEAPTGEMPVLIGNGWGGVLLHESVGHGFEADFVRRGTSIFGGRLGEIVATPLCTVIDDPTRAGLRGSYSIDDEGTPAAPKTLIEKGTLTGYLHDLVSADALGMKPTGNGRRQSFRTPPIPRQSNLFLEPGDASPGDLIAGVARGIFAKGIGGGQVDIVNGSFVFEVTEGYLIEEGRITSPVRGANLIGSGPEVLRRICGVGRDFEFDPGSGTCGKEGQSQPVGVGQPTVLVSALTIGGTRL